MAHDILDPGANGDYPHIPRMSDGSLDTDHVAVGVEWRMNPRTGERIKLTVMPTLPDGKPITDVAPLPDGQSPGDVLPRRPVVSRDGAVL